MISCQKKVVRRLGRRLNHIFEWVAQAGPYENIWDLCCDHGRLGLHLYDRYPSSTFYLVDKVPKIMDKLAEDYSAQVSDRIHFITADVCELFIPADKRTLIIIAGVGGQNAISMLSSIINRLKPGETLDFMLSPNAHMFELRRFLRAKNFTLINEEFVTENRFSHEHLWLNYQCVSKAIESEALDGAGVGNTNITEVNNSGVGDVDLSREHYVGRNTTPVSIVGERVWDDMTDIKRAYVGKLINHYQRMLENGDRGVSKDAIRAYQGLLGCD